MYSNSDDVKHRKLTKSLESKSRKAQILMERAMVGITVRDRKVSALIRRYHRKWKWAEHIA